VLEYLNREQIGTPLLRLGLGDTFPSQGSREQVLEEYGLDPASIRRSIVNFTTA
jgi:deoxyxylulose-5-phosphate synthase